MIRACDHGHPPTRVASGSRCAACERRRPSPNARGYDALHQRARAVLLQQVVDAGGSLPCGYGCGTRVTITTVVAAHVVDDDPSAGWIAACRSCNERAKRRGWGGIEEGGEAANTRARQSEVRPGFSLFSGGRPRTPIAVCRG